MCAVFLHLAFQTSVKAASNNVLSGNIKEADGTTGQDTNSGAGVKTGHIQNGAVTDAKISGVISVAKFPVGTTAGTVAAGNHSHDAQYQQKYANVIVVAKGGGGFLDPIAAMDSITDASASNPYLFKIMPGVYDLGSSTLYMKQYVDVEGAGEDVTVIKSAATTGGWPLAGTVNGAANSEIRFLRVENTGSGPVAGGIVNDNGASSRLSHISVIAVSESAVNCFGIYNYVSSQPMTNVNATVSGGVGSLAIGIWNSYSSPNMTDITINVSGTGNGSYGVYNSHSSPVMSNVVAAASGGASVRGVYNESFSSPVMSDVRATASGGENNFGVYNTASSLATMLNVNAVASGAANTSTGILVETSTVTIANTISTASGGAIHNIGIENQSSTLTLTNVSASATGGAGSNFGIENQSSTLSLSNVSAVANNGFANYGLSNSGSSPDILIDRCTIEGSTSAVWNNGSNAMRIGASKMAGPVNGGGVYTCVASYDESYQLLDSACQ